MTDHLVPEKRSENMRKIHSKDTKPEIRIRKELHRRGYRYRLHVKDLPGHPDIVLPKYRTVIDVRGCFWHGHGCRRGNRPKSNTDYWDAKILRNMERDRDTEQKLKSLGWKVIVVWECQCSNAARCEDTTDRLESDLRRDHQKKIA